MTVASILAQKGSDTITISPDQTLHEAAALLDKHKIGALLGVTSSGKLAGILSERDIVRAVSRDGAAALKSKVSDYMTAKVVTCSSPERVMSVMRKMSEGKFRHVPVVDDGKIAGVISIGDVVKRRIAEIEMEWKAMQDYIATG